MGRYSSGTLPAETGHPERSKAESKDLPEVSGNHLGGSCLFCDPRLLQRDSSVASLPQNDVRFPVGINSELHQPTRQTVRWLDVEVHFIIFRRRRGAAINCEFGVNCYVLVHLGTIRRVGAKAWKRLHEGFEKHTLFLMARTQSPTDPWMHEMAPLTPA